MTNKIRPSRGALMTVSIGDTETAEWRTDPAFRDDFVRDIVKRARAKGRKFYEILDARGTPLAVGEVAR